MLEARRLRYEIIETDWYIRARPLGYVVGAVVGVLAIAMIPVYLAVFAVAFVVGQSVRTIREGYKAGREL